MTETLAIGELAKEIGVPTSTIRHYEREGLLTPTGRTAGNYRYYLPDVVDRLRFIKAAQASGFTLGHIRALLDLRDGARSPCGAVRALVSGRLAEVDGKVRELRHVQKVLRTFMAACDRVQDESECPVLKDLSLSPD